MRYHRVRPSSDYPGANATDPYPSVNLNGSLTGRAFETGSATYFDLNTGETVLLAGDSAYPGRDGSEVVEVHESHRYLPDGGCYDFSVFNDLIIIRDALSGRVKDSFELTENAYGPVKLSPDGQTLAFYWSKSHTCYNEDTSLTIFSRNCDETIRGAKEICSFEEQYLRVYDASGQRLHSLSFISDNYSYEPESELRFSLAYNNYIAWIYDDENFGTGAVVINLSTRRFVADWITRDYDTLAWSREGNLLLFDEGKTYLSRVEDGAFYELELLFDFGELIEHPDVNALNNDIAFSSGGQIFAIALDGQNVRRMTAYTDVAVDYPAWSPDGKYLSVKRDRVGFIIAADALNARLYDDHRSMGAFQLGESASKSVDSSYGRIEWR